MHNAYITRDDCICTNTDCDTNENGGKPCIAQISRFGIPVCTSCGSDVVNEDGTPCKSNDFLYQL